MDESSLVNQAQKGRVDAFNQLVLHFQSDVYNLSLRILNDSDQAEDATQTTFLSAYRNIRSFRGGSFRAWLMRIAANACYDELRRMKRRQWVSLNPLNELGEEVETPTWLVDKSDLPEDALVRRDTRQAVQSCLRELGEKGRMIVVMVDLLGMDYQEVAQAVGVPLGTVKSRLARARLKIRESLQRVDEASYAGRTCHVGISL